MDWRWQHDHIWNDEWIPKSASRKVITRRGENILTKVCDPIDPSTNQWDEHLIDLTFWPFDADRIKMIPLPRVDMDDFVAWNLTTNGVFLVHLAYHAEWEAQFGRLLNLGQGPGAMNPHLL